MNTSNLDNNDKLTKMRREVGRCFTPYDYKESFYRRWGLSKHPYPYIDPSSLPLSFPFPFHLFEDKDAILALFEGLEALAPVKFEDDGLWRRFALPNCVTSSVLAIEFFDGQVTPTIRESVSHWNTTLWKAEPVPEVEWLDKRLPLLREAVAKLQELAG
jgi:hypothetical protein